MQAKDLRIDNWFYAVHPVDGLFEMQVRGIAQDGTIETDSYGNTYGTCDCDIKYSKSIPLTEEWLLKFGIQGWFGNNRFQIQRTTDKLFEVMAWKNGIYFWLCHLEYVHQLQNLYHALTGEELEIK